MNQARRREEGREKKKKEGEEEEGEEKVKIFREGLRVKRYSSYMMIIYNEPSD